jgi:type I restriction enzyme S subunit
MSRSAQAGFNKRDLGPLLIPIPTRDEQHKIVDKLNSLMATCDRLEKSLTTSLVLTEKLAQSIVATSA